MRSACTSGRRDRARLGGRRRRLGRVLFRRLAAEGERQRQERRDAEQADADVRRAPAGALDEMLQHRRPQRAREIVAGGADRDRDAAPAHEPMRGVGDERREGRGRAEKADQRALDERELPDRSGVGGADIAEAERHGADRARHRDAVAVGERAHGKAAEAEAEHRQRIGQRGLAAGDAEFGLHRRQHDDDRPHADAADRAGEKRQREPNPGIGRVGSVAVEGLMHRWRGFADLRLSLAALAPPLHPRARGPDPRRFQYRPPVPTLTARSASGLTGPPP